MQAKDLLMSILVIGILLFLSVMPIDLIAVDYPVDESWSDDTQQRNNLKEGDPIVIAIGEWEPYVGETIASYGFIAEIVAAAMDEANIPYTLSFYPWKRCEKLILDGVAWASFPYAHSEERDALYMYSDPLFQTFTKFFYYKPQFDGSQVTYSKLEDLAKYKVGGIYANYYKPLFEAANLNVDWSSKEKDTIHKLVSGRIDLMPYGELEGWTYIRNLYPNDIQDFGFIDKAVNTDSGDLMIIIDKENAYSVELLERFNKSLMTIRANGVYDQILEKYNLK